MEHQSKKVVLTATEVASMLQLRTEEVYSLARRGVLPAKKVGHYWRFHEPSIERWLEGAEV